MPDILIRFDEFPASCDVCPFVGTNDDLMSDDYRYLYCGFPSMGEFVTDYEISRHPDCPLVELPPHGDLIDRDALKRKFCAHCDGYEYDTGSCADGDQDCMDVKIIMTAPVIVPAERSDADA